MLDLPRAHSLFIDNSHVPALEGDPIGFLRIPVPHPADFVVENGY